MNKFLLSWGMVFAYVIFNSFGALIIKHEINKFGEVQFHSFRLIVGYFFALLKSPLILCGILSIFLSAFVWMMALSRLQISLAYPVAVGLNFGIVVTAGLILLREPLSLEKIIGITLIFVSIILLSK